uniref:ANK_REP_REGION domain-containing protein n=1 Tax=Strongyloides papillosus TaxID=174720 RepID=A0A0N5C4R1_STREA
MYVIQKNECISQSTIEKTISNRPSKDSYNCISSLQLHDLNVAIKANRQDLVEFILCHNDKINLDSNLIRLPPICLAVQTRNIEVVNLLLKHGCDVNKLFVYDYRSLMTPLIFASTFGEYNIVKSLLEYGADPNITDNSHRSPLIHAIENGHFSICKMLIEYNANVNLPEKNGYTPLHIACKDIKTQTKLINLLVSHGANCDQLDFMGRSCIDIIVIKDYLTDYYNEEEWRSEEDKNKLLEVFETIEILLSSMNHTSKCNLYRLIIKKRMLSNMIHNYRYDQDIQTNILIRFILSLITKPSSLKTISKQSLNSIIKRHIEKHSSKRWKQLEKLYTIIPLEIIDYLKYKEYL